MAEGKICEVCGRVIPAASSRTKYCSDECARVAHLNQYRRSNREADGKPVEEMPPAPCWITPKDYGEITRRLGFLEGVSYGLDQEARDRVSTVVEEVVDILEKYRG